MESKNFLSVFGEYIDNDVLKGQLQNVKIESMTLFREKRNLAVTLFSEKLISPNAILKSEKQIKNCLQLNHVEFLPRFPENVFDSSFYPYIAERTKQSAGALAGGAV